jgi:hypothetical protein
VGVVELSDGSVVGMVMGEWWEHYAYPFWCAMGSLWSGSMPQGLDVGVLSNSFVWSFWSRFGRLRLLPWLVGLVLRLVEVIQFGFGGSIQWVGSVALVLVGFGSGVEKSFRRSVACSLSPFGLVGGRSC